MKFFSSTLSYLTAADNSVFLTFCKGRSGIQKLRPEDRNLSYRTLHTNRPSKQSITEDLVPPPVSAS